MADKYIFRMERKDGMGIYALPGFEMRSDSRHPAPEQDSLLGAKWGVLGDKYEWYFGFNSIEQLRRWFYSDELLLKAEGANCGLSVYQCPEEYVLEGYTQAAFKRKEAKRIAHYPGILAGIEECQMLYK